MRDHVLAIGLFSVVFGCGGNSSGGSGDDQPPYKPPYDNCAGTAMPPPPPSGSLCLDNPTQPPGSPPIAVIEQWFETYMGVPAVHIRVTFDPTFADNTYGANQVGWPKGHKFGDLTGSDHAEITALDSQGNVVLQFDLDYLSADPNGTCGYSSLGVDGGEGKVLVGPRDAILGWSTSMDANFNEHGYCDYLVDSPATDENCTPNPDAPLWDFRMMYEVWIAASAFGPNVFGSAYMSEVHASPSKAMTNTVETAPGECPCIPIDNNQCAEPPGGGCTTNSDCPTEQFCYDMQCIPKIQ